MPFTAFDKITDDITVYAKWTAKSGGGSSSGGSPSGGDQTTPPEETPESGEAVLDEPETPLAEPPAFSDVKGDDWFYDSVLFVFGKGLFKGTSEETFEPNASMTRAMFVTVLSRLEFGSDENTPDAVSPFMDLTQGWYKKAVAWGSGAGIVKGTSETEFAPNLPVTREQMAVFMYRYAKNKGLDMTFDEDDVALFEDVGQISDYAGDAMRWAVSSVFIKGMTPTTLAPKESATRAQVATIVMRFYSLISEID